MHLTTDEPKGEFGKSVNIRFKGNTVNLKFTSDVEKPATLKDEEVFVEAGIYLKLAKFTKAATKRIPLNEFVRNTTVLRCWGIQTTDLDLEN